MQLSCKPEPTALPTPPSYLSPRPVVPESDTRGPWAQGKPPLISHTGTKEPKESSLPRAEPWREGLNSDGSWPHMWAFLQPTPRNQSVAGRGGLGMCLWF